MPSYRPSVGHSGSVTDREPIDGVVIPTEPGARSLVGDDAWRLLFEDRGLLLTWTKAPDLTGDAWGTALRGASALSQQLGAVLSQAGGAVDASSGVLCRLELPTGSTLRDLVPAVGGGVRGLVRDGRGINGHARFHVHTGRAAAGVGLGPLLGLLAVQVGTEMLARHQQEQKLTYIAESVAALRQVHEDDMEARLGSVEAALGEASAAMLDRVSIPSSIGLGTARSNLREVKERALMWLDRWEEAARQLPGTGGVDAGRMQDVLAAGGPRDDHRRFPHRIAMLYRALTLDSRALVVTGAEAGLQNGDHSLSHLHEELARGLRRNATTQDRLKQLLWDLAAPPITYTFPWEGSEAMALDRMLASMATSVSRLPDAPALLTERNRQVLELLRRPNGEVRVLAPRAA